MFRRMTFTGLVCLASAAMAQDITPTQFKQLCETSPLNQVVLRAPVKILGTAPAVTSINTGCRVNFQAGAKLEADQAAFSFAGPLVFQAGPTAEVKLVKSTFSAPSVQITEGQASILDLSESTVKATSGNITIALGASGNVTAAIPYLGEQNALEAAGAITISGGARSTFNLGHASAVAGANFAINFTGVEATFQLQNSTLSAGGPLSVIAGGAFGNFDLSTASLTAGAGVTLSARGAEGKISLSQVEVDGGSGSVAVTAGVGAAPKGSITVTSTNIISGGSVTVLASRNSNEGQAVVEVSNITAQGDLRVESGNIGTTTVLNNGLTSPTLIRAFTPPNGSCVAENNTAVAPQLRLCR